MNAGRLSRSRLTKRRAGSGHGYAIDGTRVPSVTTILRNVLDKPALRRWAAKEAAAWAATHADLLAAIGEREFIEQAASAPNRTSGRKADHGTDVHNVLLAVTAFGEATDVPDDLRDKVTMGARFLDAWGVEPIAAERPCYNATWRYAGTFDLLARLNDGSTWLLDWKTGSGPWVEQALQLVGYAECEHYQDTDGNDVPMPPVDRLGFVMLTDNEWELVPVIGDRAELWRYFQHARNLNEFVERSTPNSKGNASMPVLGEPLPLPALHAVPS